jgi:hypothetical protein
MKTGYLLKLDDKISLGTTLFKDFYEASSSLPGGKKTFIWLKYSQTIRRALENFWNGPRDCSRRMLERSDFSTEEVRASLEIILANLSPKCIRVVEADEQKILARIKSACVLSAVPS